MVTPCVDVFATAEHHQLPKYIYPDHRDEKAMGCNAFAYKWDPSVTLYANPPWKLIPYVITKIFHDRSRVLLVTPLWVDAPWMETLKEITQRCMVWRKKLYLRNDGSVWKVPHWPTLFSYVVGEPLEGVVTNHSQ